MSTFEEIQEVYLSDIANQSKVLRTKNGILPFLDGNLNGRVHRFWEGIPVEDIRVSDQLDGDEQ